MKKRAKSLPLRTSVIYIALLIIGAFFIYVVRTYPPQATAERFALDGEMNQIQVLPGSNMLTQSSSVTTQNAKITSVFTSTSGLEDIRGFYGQEFSRLGWTFVKEIKHDNPANSEGALSLSYCKGSYMATLRYHPPVEPDRWRYAIDLNWWQQGCTST